MGRHLELMNRIYGLRFRPSTPDKFERGSVMSIEALNWVFQLPIRNMRAKAILLALANHADKDDATCYPSLKRIGRSAGCSEQTARRILKDLERWKLVTIDREPGRVPVYTLNFDWSRHDLPVQEPVEKVMAEADHPCQNERGPLPNPTPTPSKSDVTPDRPVTLIIEPFRNHQENRGSPRFEEGWKTLRTALASVQPKGG